MKKRGGLILDSQKIYNNSIIEKQSNRLDNFSEYPKKLNIIPIKYNSDINIISIKYYSDITILSKRSPPFSYQR